MALIRRGGAVEPTIGSRDIKPLAEGVQGNFPQSKCRIINGNCLHDLIEGRAVHIDVDYIDLAFAVE
jgi:hypothetical protein